MFIIFQNNIQKIQNMYCILWFIVSCYTFLSGVEYFQMR